MKKRGRPPLADGIRQEHQVGLRLTPALFHQVKEAAAAHGYSLNREVETRLRASFDTSSVLDRLARIELLMEQMAR